MKAVLVIDMPPSCTMCHQSFICEAWVEETERWKGYNDRLACCPLKPLPSKKDVTVKRIEDTQSYSITEVADNISARIILKTNEIFVLGWNACLDSIIGNDCIDEITGEKDESNHNT